MEKGGSRSEELIYASTLYTASDTIGRLSFFNQAYRNMFMHTKTYPHTQIYTCMLTDTCACICKHVYAYTHISLFMYNTIFNGGKIQQNKFLYINKYIHFTFNTINTIKHIQTSGKEDPRSKNFYK